MGVLPRPAGTPAGKQIAWIVIPILPIVLGALFFSSSGRDDTYITYWPAYTLAESGRMVNYNGESVEQSSSLLLVLILALTRKLTGIDLVYLGYGISILCGSLAVFFAMRISRSIHPGTYILSGLLTATSTYWTYWSFGGMEMTLFGMIALILIQAFRRYMERPNLKPGPTIPVAAAMLVFLISRPEAPFTLAGFLVLSFLLISPIQSRQKKTLLVALIFIVNALLVFASRKIFFNSLLPQPALAKAAFPPSLETMIGGLKYGIYTLFWSPWIGLFTGIAAIGVALFLFNRTKSKEKNLQVPLLVAFAAIQTMFIIFSGGDWMEGGRFFVPIVPVLAILVALAVEASIQRKTRRMVMGSVLICLQLGLTATFVVAKSTGLPILSAIKCYRFFGADLEIGEYKWFERTNQVHLRDIGILYHLDRLIPQIRRKSPRVCILTGAMGMVPYHLAKRYGSNDFYFMDIYALTDRNFTTCPITSSLPRASMGLQLSLKGFLALWPALSRECRIPEPDVILGTYRDQEDLDLYEDYGYRMIFLQDEYARDVIPRPLLRPQFKMFLAVHHRHDLSPISGR